MTQGQIASVVGGVVSQSMSRVESGVFRLSFPKLSRLLQPLQDQPNWTWHWADDGTFRLVDADPGVIFDPKRAENYEALADDGHTGRKMVDPTTALLLTQWEKLDSRDRAMVLSVVLRLAEAEQAGSAPKKDKDK